MRLPARCALRTPLLDDLPLADVPFPPRHHTRFYFPTYRPGLTYTAANYDYALHAPPMRTTCSSVPFYRSYLTAATRTLRTQGQDGMGACRQVWDHAHSMPHGASAGLDKVCSIGPQFGA